MDRELFEVTEDTWKTVLGLAVRRHERAVGAGVLSANAVMAAVEIEGAWEGTFMISFTEKMARRATSIMFQISAEKVTEEDCRDAIGELANIVGGNIKAVLPGPSTLRPPIVAQGSDAVMLLRGRVLEWLDLECETSPFSVVLISKRTAS